MRQDPVLVDARQLASGTIARLIGDPRYDAIDKAQAAFVEFVAAHPGEFETWVDAWAAFQPN